MARVKTPSRYRDRQVKHKPRGIKDKEFEQVYWPYLPLLVIIGLLLFFSAQGGILSRTIKHPGTKVLSYASSMSQGGLLDDTNTARTSNGLSSLRLNSQLDAAAQAKANDMASRNYWSHYTPEGSPPWIFVTAQGYAYQKLGENLAAGFTDEQSTINGWMASPPHRDNMLDSRFSDVGFGFANNPDYTSGGGGPMTIVVAFYGQPVTESAPVASVPSTPSAPASTTPKAASSSPTAASTTPTSSAPPSDAASISDASDVTKHPVTTASSAKPVVRSIHTSGAQLVLAKSPASRFATNIAAALVVLALGIWLSRHVRTIRRCVNYGEKFAITHPLVDVGLIVIAALAFLLTRTSGLIQ